jgi:hypothetical protein
MEPSPEAARSGEGAAGVQSDAALLAVADFFGEAALARVTKVIFDGLADVLVELDLAVGDLAERGHGRLVVALEQRTRALGELTRALRGEDDEREAVTDLLEAIFDRDASQWSPPATIYTWYNRAVDSRLFLDKVKPEGPTLDLVASGFFGA